MLLDQSNLKQIEQASNYHLLGKWHSFLVILPGFLNMKSYKDYVTFDF